ncbi:hypothetical protein [uncultured Psychrosphaera sp.]|uniref:hypothetical protein n=1 Tax=uncultured Psychrosphaera sp. TaxID=1403522 RepID=UPI002604CF1B|nr:hypothetical protein [uncultured Psychrosphaera sp.]
MKTPFYKGAQGNLSKHIVTVALSALAVSGTKVIAEDLPLGTEITSVTVIGAALGVDTAYKLDLVDRDSNVTALVASTTSTSATSKTVPLKPIYVGDEGPSDIVLTNSGTGAATGEVTVHIEYRFVGY